MITRELTIKKQNEANQLSLERELDNLVDSYKIYKLLGKPYLLEINHGDINFIEVLSAINRNGYSILQDKIIRGQK